MGYDAMLKHGQETGDHRAGGAPVQGGALVRSWSVAGDGGGNVWGQSPDGASLVPDLEAGGPGGLEGRGAAGPAAAAGSSAAGARGYGVARRPAGPRVPHRPLDPAPGGRAHPAPHWRAVSPGTCVVPAAETAVVAAAARAAGTRARRGGDSTVGGAAVAGRKKTPAASGPGSSSRTKAAFPSSPSSAGRGHPVARPLS
jgi:hypothetical protein